MKTDATTDQDILTSLNGIVEMQRTIRRNALDISVQTGLVFLRIYYQRLPLSVSRRLAEINPHVVASIPHATVGMNASERWYELGDKVAGDAAFAQAIRAANSYRRKLGLPLLEHDGRPAVVKGEASESE